MVGIKNYKPENDISNIDCLERHNETDELFILLRGTCILLCALEDLINDSIELKAISMELNKVYNIPKGLWHNTITQQETKLILIESASTSQQNSNVIPLSYDQIARAKELISALQK
jgi:ureidoglycolate hydrolase